MKCLLSLFYFIFFVSHAATNIYLYYHIVHMCQKLIWWCKRNHYLRRHSINHIAISSWRTANNDKIKHIGIDQYFDRWCFPSIDIMFLNYVIMLMNNMLYLFVYWSPFHHYLFRVLGQTSISPSSQPYQSVVLLSARHPKIADLCLAPSAPPHIEPRQSFSLHSPALDRQQLGNRVLYRRVDHSRADSGHDRE